VSSSQKTRLLVMSGWGSPKIFGDLFDSVYQHGNGNNIYALNLGPGDTLVLEGGTDINPNFYGQRPINVTQNPDTQRDAAESIMMKKVIAAKGSILGICRGAQFITAKAGGELIQHVTSHHGNHMMITHTGKPILTNSFHHQMMFPFGLPKEEYKILAHTPQRFSRVYLIEDEEDVKNHLPKDFVEPEVVWYPKIRGLGIQGHPEFVGFNPTHPNKGPLAEFVNYSRNLVKEYILNDLPV